MIESNIFAGFFTSPEMSAIFQDRQLVQYWLSVEAALARAQARLNIIPASAADEISKRAQADLIDLEALREGTELVGYPILPLVRQLAARCEGDAGRYVHWGATTQDIMDTANVLQLRQALELINRDLTELVNRLARLAKEHRDLVLPGRTHGQHALPITLGLKFAIWIDELERHLERFDQCRPRLLRCQFGGASGTLASLGKEGWQVHQVLSAELSLNTSPVAWHSARDSLAEFVSLCGLLTATLGKMAREVAVLQQTEFGELEEPFVSGKGSSSTMPQKRNPILCETVIGIAHLAGQAVPAMLQAMKPEHERAMGEWHIEWDVVPHVCQLTGAALKHSLEIFQGLVVHPEAMEKNLALTGGQIVAEAVMMRLGEFIGRQRAHEVVYEACARAVEKQQPLLTILQQTPDICQLLSQAELESLTNPVNYVGLAPFFVDKVLSRIPPGDGEGPEREHGD